MHTGRINRPQILDRPGQISQHPDGEPLRIIEMRALQHGKTTMRGVFTIMVNGHELVIGESISKRMILMMD